MKLPKMDYPIYKINVPSLKKDFSFRPFLVKEEKLLLMAKESENASDILTAIKQIINNCLLDKLDVNKLALFDLEYIFLKLRSASVDNKIKVSYRDNEDDELYDFEINLDDVAVVYPEKVDNKIKITEKTGIVMKYPSAALYDDKEFLKLDKDYMFELILRCVDSIYNEDELYEAKDYKREDLTEFLENLDVKTFQNIQEFLVTVPKMEYKINYKNKMEHDREIVLNSLNDFFTLR